MTRRTKASRREAFRRSFRRVMMSAAMAPIEGRPGPWDETRTAEWTVALDAVDALLRGAPLAVR